MVVIANWTSRPLRGWVQVFAASSSMAGRSAPRAGGALNRCPTTEKRKRAHAAEEETSLVITGPHKSGERIVTRTVRTGIPAVRQGGRECTFCGSRRPVAIHQEILIVRPPAIVIGERKHSSFPHSSHDSALRTNASRSARGSAAATSRAGLKRPRAIFQNWVWGKCSC